MTDELFTKKMTTGVNLVARGWKLVGMSSSHNIDKVKNVIHKGTVLCIMMLQDENNNEKT